MSKFGEDTAEQSDRTGHPYKRVWNWKQRGAIPQEWHQPLLDRAAEVGVDLLPADFVAHLHRPVASRRSVQPTGQGNQHGT